MSDVVRNIYGTPEKPIRVLDTYQKDPYESSEEDEDWLRSLKMDYKNRAGKESSQWIKDHSDDFFKEGEDLYNLESEYNKKSKGLDLAFDLDSHKNDLRKRINQAESYRVAAMRNGWEGTAAKQKAVSDNLEKEFSDYKKSFTRNYVGEDLSDRWENRKHPMMDELNTINSNIEKEFNDAVAAKKKGFEDALNGRSIYFGRTGKDNDRKWDFFLENPSEDESAPKTYKRIGQRKFSKFPMGKYRGLEDYMAYPDPTQEFDDVPATDIEYLQNHKGLNDYQKVGERDSTD